MIYVPLKLVEEKKSFVTGPLMIRSRHKEKAKVSGRISTLVAWPARLHDLNKGKEPTVVPEGILTIQRR
jgi:hypothetical protein